MATDFDVLFDDLSQYVEVDNSDVDTQEKLAGVFKRYDRKNRFSKNFLIGLTNSQRAREQLKENRSQQKLTTKPVSRGSGTFKTKKGVSYASFSNSKGQTVYTDKKGLTRDTKTGRFASKK